MTQLLVATHNQGKVAELNRMVGELGIECISLSDAGIKLDVEETATTFYGNALLKAQAYARLSGLYTLADDSGLEVDALAGAPGVYTARFGGKEISQPERNALLLEKVVEALAGGKSADSQSRAARFRCVVVVCDPAGNEITSAAGVCEGEIALASRGSHGFGYDPVFYLPERGQTMAELESADKLSISHRADAFRQVAPLLQQLLSGK